MISSDSCIYDIKAIFDSLAYMIKKDAIYKRQSLNTIIIGMMNRNWNVRLKLDSGMSHNAYHPK